MAFTTLLHSQQLALFREQIAESNMFECLKVSLHCRCENIAICNRISAAIRSYPLAFAQVNAMPPPPPAGKCYVMPFPVKVSRCLV